MRHGATSKEALRRYVCAGVRVFSKADLHTKVYVFGDVAVVGSANLFERAAQRLLRAAGEPKGEAKLAWHANYREHQLQPRSRLMVAG
jgi:hypothetical protein